MKHFRAVRCHPRMFDRLGAVTSADRPQRLSDPLLLLDHQ